MCFCFLEFVEDRNIVPTFHKTVTDPVFDVLLQADHSITEGN